jgi:transposase
LTETGGQLGAGNRLTLRLREHLERSVSGSTRSAADVAREYGVSWWSVNHALVVKAASMTCQSPCGVRLLGVDETRARSLRRLLAEHGLRRGDPRDLLRRP